MVNDEILGGLRSALERGETLKRAMMTMFNAGYQKQEIEEAASVLSPSDMESKLGLLEEKKPLSTEMIIPSKQQKMRIPSEKKSFIQSILSPSKQPKPEKQKMQNVITPSVSPQPVQVISGTQGQVQQVPVFQPIQIVSSYGEQRPYERIIIFILIFLLIFLSGLLITIFIFKQELLNLFSSIFAKK